ncbi:hypothetical protein DEA8626_03447 [Defluviimonas aquaemixtae]|uniref:Hedgehog/Intein (Hint) domain-containing protein n=1 Tax=Albidovulum aquaemixtae TaxID=1542388 RepID=A0A2R8BLV2_9RHOB|nr:Hint domain-containing protein [Defluviimonas aquaemixtae]SPH24395.1 hypothetical protein DEA8626_03447 [Defluviimonas aquaemixtae]
MVARTIELYDDNLLNISTSSPLIAPGNSIINNSDTPNGAIPDFSEGSTVTVTIEDTSWDPNLFEDDDYANDRITDGSGLVANGTGVKADSLIFIRVLDEMGNPIGPTISVTVVTRDNVTQNIWGFRSDSPPVEGTQYVKTGGNSIGSASYTTLQSQPVCYSIGALADTPDGSRAVETLQAGDLVTTLHNGPQEILWIHRSDEPLGSAERDAKSVLNAAVFLGPGLPAKDLIVPPQHRILVGGCEQFYNRFEFDASAPAKSLTSLPGIRPMPGKRQITWLHFACRAHEIIVANGCLSESLLFGQMGIEGLTGTERRTVAKIFGSSSIPNEALNGPPAQRYLTAGTVRRQLKKSRNERTRRRSEAIKMWDADLSAERYAAILMCDDVIPRNALGFE